MTPKSKPTPVAMLNVVGAAIQLAGPAIALPAGIVAAKRSSRRAGGGRPRGAQ